MDQEKQEEVEEKKTDKKATNGHRKMKESNNKNKPKEAEGEVDMGISLK
jgi:hypothetical protein